MVTIFSATYSPTNANFKREIESFWQKEKFHLNIVGILIRPLNLMISFFITSKLQIPCDESSPNFKMSYTNCLKSRHYCPKDFIGIPSFLTFVAPASPYVYQLTVESNSTRVTIHQYACRTWLADSFESNVQ